MPTENKPADPGFDLNTPDGGRGYIDNLFKTVLKRHDYRQYINERLAGDFACTLAQHFEEVKAREQALQQRLNAADQRIDDLEELLTEALRSVDYHAGMQRLGENDRLYDLLRRIKETLPVKCSDTRPTDQVQFKGMIEARGGKFAIMIDEANAHYGWTFQRHPDGMWVSGRKATDAEMQAARQYARANQQ